MVFLLIYSWLLLPLAPLNPVEQDTLPLASFHFSAGLSGPTSVLSAGPEITAKYEMLIVHPLVVRAEGDFRFSTINSAIFPRGDFRTTTFALDAIYYRGTNILLAYLGGGIVYALNGYSPTGTAADSLWRHYGISEVNVTDVFGYRFTLGLRIQRSYSVEIAVTETRPDMQYISSHGPGSYSIRNQYQLRTGGFRLSFGYLLPVSRR